MSKKSTIVITVIASVVSAAITGILAWSARGLYDIYFHKDINSKISGIQGVLDEMYLYDYDETEAADNAALGIIMSLDDPYTMYYSKQQFNDYITNAQGDFVGIGVTVVLDKENNEIDVVSVMDNSPGMEAGILPGDVIVKVDGEPCEGTQMNDVVSKIRGIHLDNPENTSVTVTVKRNNDTLDLIIVRKRIHQKTVTHKMVTDDIGLIRLSAFNIESESGEKATNDEFSEALELLTKDGMKKLIIDVRDNGGGDLDVVAGIIDSIVPEGLIMYSEDKFGNRDELKSDSNELNIPMVVLVNGNSASASELFTGALKDYNKAKVIGTTTFGKGVMQRILPFSDGSGMVVTIAKYFTPNGICVHEEGITPDITVEQSDKYKELPVSSIPENEDTQLKAALDYLNK